MIRFNKSFAVAFLLLATPLFAGELRTGRGSRSFVVDKGDQERLAAEVFASVDETPTSIKTAKVNRRMRVTPAFRRAGSGVLRQTSLSDSEAGSKAPAAQLAPDEQIKSSYHLDGAPLGDLGCNQCGQCSQCSNYFLNAEFLLWWRRGRSLPPLASTNILGVGEVLYGDQVVGDSARPGARFELGGFFDYDHCDSVSGRFWALGDSQARFDSRNLPTGVSVVRPFIDFEPGSPTLNMETGLPINAIGGSTGHMQVTSEATVWGAELLLRHAFYRSHGTRGDVIYGYQATRVDEDVAIDHNFTNTGVNVVGRDVFDTKNAFHGAVLGLQVVSHEGPWTLDFLAKIGLGDMHQRVHIDGFEFRDDGATIQAFNGSLLALPTNIGFRERNKFAVVPELGFQTRWQAQPNMELSFGYSFVYWSDVVQAGDIIDRVVNGSQTSGGALNGSARPEFRFDDGSYWVHGLSLGLTWLR